MAAKRANMAREDWYRSRLSHKSIRNSIRIFKQKWLSSFRSAVAMTSVTVGNVKRGLEEVDSEEHSSNAKRNKLEPLNPLWKFWLVKNYTISEGSVVACRDVVEHSEKERESLEIAVPLTSLSLALIVRDTWGEKIKKARRGPRNNQKLCFLNVAHKRYQARPSDPDLTQEFHELIQNDSLILPKSWFKIVDRQNRVSFVRPETWEFDNQRIYTEIVIELSMEQRVTYLIKSHGCELNLNHLNIEKVMQDLPIKTQAEAIIKYAENLKMCSGYRLSGDSAIIAMVPHRAGIFRSLSNEILTENGAFSSKCQLFHYAGGRCPKCCMLGKIDKKRKQRKEEQQSIHRHCNKRFLTKEEIQLQLKEEKKLKKKNLEEKGKCEFSESEDDDCVSQNESDGYEEKD